MAIIDWWNSLTIAAQIFYCIAIPSTLVLFIQTLFLFLGIGEDGDTDVDLDADTDLDGDIADDLPDVDEIDTDLNGFDGLKLFTVRGIIAFLVVFGWVGVVMDAVGAELYITIPVAAVCGIAMMVLLAWLFKAVMKLRGDGNLDNRNAVGVSGKVFLTIPPSRTGEGKVHLMLQGVYTERNAVTDEPEAIPTGAEVVIVRISGGTDLVVRRK